MLKKADTNEVKMNTNAILFIILPNLLGLFIRAIEVVIFKNINGTMEMNNRFKNKSPRGLTTKAFSFNTNPPIIPIIKATNMIIVF